MIAKTTADIKVRRSCLQKKSSWIGENFDYGRVHGETQPRQDIIIPLGPTLATTDTCEPRIAIAVVVAVVVSVVVAVVVAVIDENQ